MRYTSTYSCNPRWYQVSEKDISKAQSPREKKLWWMIENKISSRIILSRVHQYFGEILRAPSSLIFILKKKWNASKNNRRKPSLIGYGSWMCYSAKDRKIFPQTKEPFIAEISVSVVLVIGHMLYAPASQLCLKVNNGMAASCLKVQQMVLVKNLYSIPPLNCPPNFFSESGPSAISRVSSETRSTKI